jgi:hypothetical protein
MSLMMTRDDTGKAVEPRYASAHIYKVYILTPSRRTEVTDSSIASASTTSVPPALSDAQLSEAREVFDIFDLDCSGSIDTNELTIALQSLGFNPSATQVDTMLQQADLDANGTLDCAEFVAMVAVQNSLAAKLNSFASQNPPGERSGGATNPHSLMVTQDANGNVIDPHYANAHQELPLDDDIIGASLDEALADGGMLNPLFRSETSIGTTQVPQSAPRPVLRPPSLE